MVGCLHCHKECDPTKVPVHLFGVGNMQMRLGQYKEALDSFQVAADLAPGIAGYRLREAQLLFQNAKSEEAVRMTRGVVRRNPYYAGAAALLSTGYWPLPVCGLGCVCKCMCSHMQVGLYVARLLLAISELSLP